MQRFLFTIGFTGKTAEEFFDLLRRAGAEAVIDVRQNRTGQLSAFAKHPDLAYFLKETTSIAYRHEPLLAPTPEVRKKYQADKNWDSYEASFLELLRARGVPETLDTAEWPAKIAFLCTEPGPEKCHRRLVADVLAEYWRAQGDEVEVKHLVSGPHKKSKAPIERIASGGAAGQSRGLGSAEQITGVALAGWAATLGSRRVPSEEVDRAFGMPLGKLRDRAGIESLSYAAAEQNELTLADAALRQALHVAGCPLAELDWIIATSETHREYPS
ncbi:MAG: DUF488 family protein, partial [Candidatus Acidiferrum sp.]